MNVLITDDTEMHRALLRTALAAIAAKLPSPVNILAEGTDGSELVQIYQRLGGTQAIDIVFCDIRMPKMDGLSALVKIKSMNPRQKVVMVSSEDLARVTKLGKSAEEDRAKLEEAKKFELIERVADRIRKNVHEAGKLNSILEGCEKLVLDPIRTAEHFGASGYLHKPYDAQKLLHILQNLATSEEFLAA